jgi:diacylglycerol kinase (ATP)
LRILVIFNPRAAAGRNRRLLPRLEAELADRSLQAEIRTTAGAGHATELVAGADLAGFEGLAAVGGDGTVFEVLNGLYRQPPGHRVPLGVVPVGTGNAFARDLGLAPSAWRRGLDIIAAGRTRRVDVGHAQCAADAFHFLNVIGMGLPVEAGLAARRLKFLGNGAYTVSTLWRTLRLRSHPLEIELDGRRFRQDNVFVEVSNSRYTGTTFLIAPAARLDDGLLDVTLLRDLPRRRLWRLFPTVYSGRHVQYDEVDTCQARRILISAPPGMPLAVDGEFRGASPVEIRCLQRDLELFCDEGEAVGNPGAGHGARSRGAATPGGPTCSP